MPRAETALAFRQHPVHVRDVNWKVAQNFVGRQAFRHGIRGRLAARRHVSESHNDAHGEALREGRAAGGGPACVQAFLQVWDRRLVGAVQVLEDLGRGPLAFRVASQLAGLQAAGDLGDGVLDALQVDVQEMFPSVYNAMLPQATAIICGE